MLILSSIILSYTIFYIPDYLKKKYCHYKKKQAQKQLLVQENRKRELLKTQIRLADKEYQRDSILFVKEVISESEIEQRHQNRLQFQSSLVDMEVNILNIKSSLKQLRSDLKK